jgi:hypothetical protein
MPRTNLLMSSSAALIVLAATGCSSEFPSGESGGPLAELRSAGNRELQDALLSKIGRGLAVALADPVTRAWLRTRIDASPYVEWRIPFREVLINEAALPEMRRVSQLAQLTSVAAVRPEELPPLELYFPIPAHRAAWRPSAPVQVAVRIGHSDRYTLYSSEGTASITRGDHVPSVATLVLAPSEIDFGHLPSALRGGSHTGPGMLARAQAWQSGAGVTALPPPDEPPPPPPASGGANSSRHTRLSYFKTTRYHDDWLGGSDEVEIYGSVLGGFKECTWRTDVSPHRDYYMDVATSFSTIATAVPWGTATLFIEAFEDDDGRCLRRSSDDRYGSTFLSMNQYGQIFGTSNPGHIAVRVEAIP